MPTPWGRAQATTTYASGLLKVDTAGHGGLLLSRSFAAKNLSEAGRKRGEEFGQWLAYEEDSAVNIIFYELERFFREPSPELMHAGLRIDLERDFPGYLEELAGAAPSV